MFYDDKIRVNSKRRSFPFVLWRIIFLLTVDIEYGVLLCKKITPALKLE